MSHLSFKLHVRVNKFCPISCGILESFYTNFDAGKWQSNQHGRSLFIDIQVNNEA